MITTDKIIRDALKKRLAKQHHKESHTKIIDEFELLRGGARIDLAVINGVLHGYELKSDVDNLERLPWQMEAYNAVFDKITIVVGREHLFPVLRTIPDWWGLILAKINPLTSLTEFIDLRESNENPQRNSLAIAKLLWRSEALDVLKQTNNLQGMRSKNRNAICEYLVSSVGDDYLRDQVRCRLLSR